MVVGQVVFQNSMRWCDLLNGDRRRGTQQEQPNQNCPPVSRMDFSIQRHLCREANSSGQKKPQIPVKTGPPYRFPLPSPCRTNNSGARMKISRPTPWPARISGYHENIPRPRPLVVVVATEISPFPFKPFEAGPLCSTRASNRGRDRLSLYCLF